MSKWKHFDGEMKLKLSCKRLFPTDSVKYSVVKTDGSLLWKSHIDYLSVKLNRANALLFKIRNLVNNSIPVDIDVFKTFSGHLKKVIPSYDQIRRR